MIPSNKVFSFLDNGGGRSGIERRQFSYTSHIPERRSGKDRRSADDRRKLFDSAMRLERTGERERRAAVLKYLHYFSAAKLRSYPKIAYPFLSISGRGDGV